MLNTISIHAPREGGDWDFPLYVFVRKEISIHAPREGGDLSMIRCTISSVLFQSTPPASGAT